MREFGVRLIRLVKAEKAVVFAVLFGLIGATILILTHASPNSTTIKPQLTGIINRSGTIPQAYDNYIEATTVNVSWSSLQATEDGPITHPNLIDEAISTAQTTGTRLFVNIQAGQYAPDWAKAIGAPRGNPDTFYICNDQGVDPAGKPQTECGYMPRWWETEYENDYENLMQQLAALYDNVPQVAMVGIDGCMTIFNEPLIREANPPSNLYAYWQAGLTTSGDEQCQQDEINAMQPWVHTQSFLSFNPYQEWQASSDTDNCSQTDTSPCGKFKTDEDYTESLIDYCRQALGYRCVVGNESVGNNSTYIIPASEYSCSEIDNTPGTPGYSAWAAVPDYERLYTKIRCVGPPIEMQSATPIKEIQQGSPQSKTIPWAISYGAGGFQPQPGYDEKMNSNIYISRTEILNYNAQFAANANPAPGNTAPPDSPSTPTTVSPTGNTSPTWTWIAPSDSGGPGLATTPYTVEWSQSPTFASGVLSDTSTLNTYTTPHLTDGTWYFQVKASDIFGDTSSYSPAGSVVIDTTPPLASITSPVAGATVSGTVPIDTSVTDSSGIASVKFYINGILVGTDFTSPFNYSWDSTTASNGNNTILIVATDNLGNKPTSAQVKVNVQNTGSVTPSRPTKLAASNVSYNQVSLSWSPSIETGGTIKGYYVLRFGGGVGSFTNITPSGVTSANYVDDTVSANTKYYYQVIAYDSNNDFSQPSAPINVLTPVNPNPTTPNAPTKLRPTAIGTQQINLGWTASTSTGVVGYNIFRGTSPTTISTTPINGSNLVTSTSYGDTNLAPSTNYSYYVEAVNNSALSSLPSNIVSATTIPVSQVTTVAGTVTNQSNQGVSNVYISTNKVGGGTISAFTNSAGQYVLTNILSNVRYSYHFSLSGYKTISFSAKYPAGVITLNEVLKTK